MTPAEDTIRAETRAPFVLYTGGTFGMRDLGGGLEVEPNLEDALAALIPPTASAAEWRYLQLERIIDSADADLAHALSVASLIRAHADQTTGMVVVHGTDTLAYTAAVAAFALIDLPFPIVFTGAQRSVNEVGSDAPGNFAAACREAQTRTPGVRLAFGGSVIPAVRAIKRSSDADEAFAALRPLTPGARGARALRLHSADLDRLARIGRSVPGAPQRATPSVGLLRVFPGFAPELIEAAARLYPDGLVLECYGAGTAPMSTPGLYDAVSDACRRGIPVVALTQCHTGEVRLERYALGAALQRAGAWSGSDLTADAALAKLGVLAALGLEGSARRRIFETNLVGEQLPTRGESSRGPATDVAALAHSPSISGRTTAST